MEDAEAHGPGSSSTPKYCLSLTKACKKLSMTKLMKAFKASQLSSLDY